jgi:hypothetical protein
VSVEQIQTHLRSLLPEYMVPARYVFLERLPLTLNGKVDRKALAPPDRSLEGLEKRPHSDRSRFVSPTGMTEIQIATIWEEVLGCGPVGVHDNFFDLGGHSLLAIRMIAKVEQVCGKRLPVRTLFAGATIRHLVDALLEESRESYKCLLAPIRADGVRPPFFFFHGDFDGGGFYARELARQVGPEQPFYIFHPLGLDGGQVPATIEAMADEYLQALRSFRPTGPYLLGGYCNGGLIAFEMARRLQAQGEQVDFLLAIDTIAWNARFRGLKLLSKVLATALRLTEADQKQLFIQLQASALVIERWLRLCRTHPQEALRRACRRLQGTRPTPPPKSGMYGAYLLASTN